MQRVEDEIAMLSPATGARGLLCEGSAFIGVPAGDARPSLRAALIVTLGIADVKKRRTLLLFPLRLPA